MLGRKLKGKSQRELRDLGLVVYRPERPGSSRLVIEPPTRNYLDQRALVVVQRAVPDQRMCGFPSVRQGEA